ncbi:MAG TPA: ABC transporter ATP-binding protein, partial [Opitutaceae bacterium]|nr:ABC transporter ATP-binding protein [Opitutaceae bacterium]
MGEKLMSASIELRSISKRFGKVAAVDNVSLKVESGELLTLLGPSGCGKTTILRLLSGFESPTEGSILIGGEDVTGVPPNKRDINQVFQSYALFPHLTVRENIGFGLRMRRDAAPAIKDKVASAISLVSLGGMEDRYPHQLSGGQRQRVALARAIVPEPRVLLLDEPLSALDAKLRREMQVELKVLQRKLGLTTILVTHDQEEALAMSDRIAVMHAGRVEQLGTGKEVYHEPRTEFVAQFLGESNLVRARVVAVSQIGTALRTTDGWLLTAATPLGFVPAEGDEIIVSIRPERVRLSGNSGELNSISVRIMERTFLGASLRLVVEADSGRRLTVVAPNGQL